jgi:hypothetical protein
MWANPRCAWVSIANTVVAIPTKLPLAICSRKYNAIKPSAAHTPGTA